MEFEKWISFAAKEERALTAALAAASASEEEYRIKMSTGLAADPLRSSSYCSRRTICRRRDRRRRHASHGS